MIRDQADDLLGMRVLILYYYAQYPPRVAIVDHLLSFRRHTNAHCVYVNLAVRPISRWILKTSFDVVVLHTTLLSTRWAPKLFESLFDQVKYLAETSAVKIALPQDEFIHTDALCHFLSETRVQRIFSVAPESEWRSIYRGVDDDAVTFHRVLTGYLEPFTVSRIRRLERTVRERPIDIGYRAYGQRFSLGRHGYLKICLAHEVRKLAGDRGFDVDISTCAEDTFYGDAWYRFLLGCQYTIGVEGGASILDRDGSIRQRVDEYLVRHPSATFDEVEASCFPEEDGSLALYALSPRHLEACATRTCQILVEGDYNGVLQSGVHYIPIRADLSNLGDVLDHLEDSERRQRIVDQAYDDVVASGANSYARFAGMVLRYALPEGREPIGRRGCLASRACGFRARVEGFAYSSWALKFVRPVRRIGQAILRHMPGPLKPAARWVKRCLRTNRENNRAPGKGS